MLPLCLVGAEMEGLQQDAPASSSPPTPRGVCAQVGHRWAHWRWWSRKGGPACAPPPLSRSEWPWGFAECEILPGGFRPAGLARLLLQEGFLVLMKTGP